MRMGKQGKTRQSALSAVLSSQTLASAREDPASRLPQLCPPASSLRNKLNGLTWDCASEQTLARRASHSPPASPFASRRSTRIDSIRFDCNGGRERIGAADDVVRAGWQ